MSIDPSEPNRVRIRRGSRPGARALRARRRGQSAVELVVVLPALVLFALPAIDLARMATTKVALYNAVREGARYGAHGRSGDSAGIQAKVLSELGQASVSSGLNQVTSVTSTSSASGTVLGGNDIQVTASYRFGCLIPMFFGTERVLTATSTLPVI